MVEQKRQLMSEEEIEATAQEATDLFMRAIEDQGILRAGEENLDGKVIQQGDLDRLREAVLRISRQLLRGDEIEPGLEID